MLKLDIRNSTFLIINIKYILNYIVHVRSKLRWSINEDRSHGIIMIVYNNIVFKIIFKTRLITYITKICYLNHKRCRIVDK